MKSEAFILFCLVMTGQIITINMFVINPFYNSSKPKFNINKSENITLYSHFRPSFRCTEVGDGTIWGYHQIDPCYTHLLFKNISTVNKWKPVKINYSRKYKKQQDKN